MKKSLIDSKLEQPETFENLTEREKTILLIWIEKHVQASPRPSKRDSYGVKHDFEHSKSEGGFYVTNGQFKGALLAAGYTPVEEDIKSHINWRFYAKFEKWRPAADLATPLARASGRLVFEG